MREWQLMHDLERNLRGRDQRLTHKARKAHLVALSRRKPLARSSGFAGDDQQTRSRFQLRRDLYIRQLRRFAAAAILVVSFLIWLFDAAV